MDKKLMKAIKKVEKEFLTEVAKRWNQHLLCSLHSTTGYQLWVYVKYSKVNPNYGDRLLMIGRALHELDLTSFKFQEIQTMESSKDRHCKYEKTIELLEELHTEYYQKFKEFNKTHKKYNEKITWTKIVNELMLRGFIIHPDAEVSNKLYYVRINVGQGLVWMIYSEGFETPKAAKSHALKFAIGKYTIETFL